MAGQPSADVQVVRGRSGRRRAECVCHADSGRVRR